MSLNIGGRNTNALEFLLDGDSSAAGEAATKARVRAQEAMIDAECGPGRMAPTERAAVGAILEKIFAELSGDRASFFSRVRVSNTAQIIEGLHLKHLCPDEIGGIFENLSLSLGKIYEK